MLRHGNIVVNAKGLLPIEVLSIGGPPLLRRWRRDESGRYHPPRKSR